MNLDKKHIQNLHYYSVTKKRKFNNLIEKYISNYCKEYCSKALYLDMDDLVIHLKKVINKYTSENNVKNNIRIILPYEYGRLKMGSLMQYKIVIKGYKGTFCSIYNLLLYTSTGNYESVERQNEYLSESVKKQIGILYFNLRKEKLKEICDE